MYLDEAAGTGLFMVKTGGQSPGMWLCRALWLRMWAALKRMSLGDLVGERTGANADDSRLVVVYCAACQDFCVRAR